MFDVIIVGAGISSYSLLMHLPKHLSVAVIYDKKKNASKMAQGGISTSLFEKNKKSHVKDTYLAGCKYGDKKVIKQMIAAGNDVLDHMLKKGITFDTKGGRLDFGLEGAHSRPRILHQEDQTGKHVMHWLHDEIKADVTWIEGDFVDYIIADKLKGVKIHSAGRMLELYTNKVVMATGGYSGMFYPASKTMMGGVTPLIKAYDAGLTLTDLEMVQFHPTMFIANDKVQCLVSEAVRGAGATLKLADGTMLMAEHPQRDLAPRHIVSSVLYEANQAGDQVYLDISGIKHFSKSFPFIHHKLKNAGIHDMIPVAPGAHYTMGGVKTKVDGKTELEGLYFIGEAARTGFHGANRLASNSLLEGLAMGKLCSETLLDKKIKKSYTKEYSGNQDAQPFDKKMLMTSAGIMRDRVTLARYIDTLEGDTSDAARFAMLIAHAALNRRVSLGAHIRSDSIGLPDFKPQNINKKGQYSEHHSHARQAQIIH